MQQIADWLEKLGMSEYAERFAENRIDVSVLRHLTDQDLKDIGVALGHRRKMLAAIHGSTSPTPTAVEPTGVVEPKSQEAAERRQVTVMFSDLVGSTALSARMDPEDLREVIAAYQKCVAETVGRFGGFVAKYMGDGVLVYFGYPQAHEDDAERAVRAGLELVAAVGDLKTQAALQTRVGIATGLVVVGDLIGSGGAQEQAVVGETPNLAARLQGIAEPNTVVTYMYALFARMYGTNNLPDSSNMCHESTSVGLPLSIGVSVGTITLDDFQKTDWLRGRW
jgi:class 3 adenylate cyclase